MAEKTPITYPEAVTIYGRVKHWGAIPQRLGYDVYNPLIIKTRKGSIEIDMEVPPGTILHRKDLVAVTLDSRTNQVLRIQHALNPDGETVLGNVIHESAVNDPNAPVAEIRGRSINTSAA